MNRFDQNTSYFLGKRSVLRCGTAPKRFLEFVRNVCPDENSFPVCHRFFRFSGRLKRPLGGTACKPNSVSSLRMTAIHLGRQLLTGSSNRRCRRAARKRFPIWSCTARSLPGRACYQTRRWALTPPFHPSPRKAGLFSVALVVTRFTGCPDVIRLAALWCSDFPP